MYSTCLFCNGALGRNESFEMFPVGRRLAFDAAKGRLWVVCPSCARWNLTPLESRWEAIDPMERAYRGTRLRASTDNVGLAKLREGTTLIRIGAPQLPEFAVWRYGQVFRSRWRKAQLIGFASSNLAVLGQSFLTSGYSGKFLGEANIVASVSAILVIQTGTMLLPFYRKRHARVRVQTGDRLLTVRSSDASRSTVVKHTDGEGWALDLHYRTAIRRRPFWQSMTEGRLDHVDPGRVRLEGDVARGALAQIIPSINREGGARRDVDRAVSLLSEGQDPLAMVVNTRTAIGWARQEGASQSPLAELSPSLRLALEMSLHEADERRALEGELRALEDRWREAEEIAAIADNMFLPPETDARLNAMKRTDHPE